MKGKKRKIPASVSTSTVSVMPEGARALLSGEAHAVLVTESAGRPYASLVAFAATPGMDAVVFATPRGTRKHSNILMNENVALLLDTRARTGGDYMDTEALTLEGIALPVRRGKKRDALAEHLLRKHPRLRDFVAAPTTVLVRVEITGGVYVSAFQSVTRWPAKRGS